MKKIAILPIRSGSKRFPGKNFYPILGEPLYKIVLQKLLTSKIFDSVIVATDESHKIAAQCEGLGIEIFQRSPSSSSDNAQTEEVISEIIPYYKFGREDWICLFQATNPFVEAPYLLELERLITLKECTSILTCVAQKRFFVDDIMKSDFVRERTQDVRETLLETGLFWAIQVKSFLKEKKRYTADYKLVKILPEHDADIDSLEDLQALKVKLQHNILAARKNFVKRDVKEHDYENYYNSPTDPDGNQRDLLNEYQERLDFAKDEIDYIRNLLTNIDLVDKLEVLDVGCGTGAISSKIFEGTSCNIIGIEPDSEAADRARMRLGLVHNTYYEEVSFKFLDNSKDFIIAFHVIEHLPDPNHFLDEMYRILRPGGYLLLSTPDFEGPVAKKFGAKFRLLHDPTHTSLFGMVGLLNSTISRGFWLERIMQPFIDTVYFTKANVDKLFDPKASVSPAFTGNVMSLILRK